MTDGADKILLYTDANGCLRFFWRVSWPAGVAQASLPQVVELDFEAAIRDFEKPRAP